MQKGRRGSLRLPPSPRLWGTSRSGQAVTPPYSGRSKLLSTALKAGLPNKQAPALRVSHRPLYHLPAQALDLLLVAPRHGLVKPLLH